jgi:hypothetical protein
MFGESLQTTSMVEEDEEEATFAPRNLWVSDVQGTKPLDFLQSTRHKVRASYSESSLIRLDHDSELHTVSLQIDFFFLQLLAQRIAFKAHKQRCSRISRP